MPPQHVIHLSQVLSVDVKEFLVQGTCWVAACIFIVNILGTFHNSVLIFQVVHLVLANIQCPLHTACIYSIIDALHG